MQNFYDLKRYCVLYVDDEEMALKYFEKAFGREFQVITARNAADGLKIIEERGDEIGVLLTDQRMPGEKGVQLLERARQLRPRLVRMLITAFADFGVTVDAVNLGNIFRYISKPLQIEDMRNTLRRAMEFYILQQERDDLLQEKLSVLHNIMITDRVTSLGILAAGLDHKLHNSLRAVQAFLELTPGRLRQDAVDLDRLRDPAFWRDFHDRVVKQAARIAGILGDVESSAGPSGGLGNAEAILKEVLAERSQNFAAQGITVQAEIGAGLPPMPGAATLRKLVDLVAQCELASLPAGKAAVISANPVGGGLQIGVRDNGPGLPGESTRAVFDPFFIRTEGPQDFGLNLMGLYFLAYHFGGNVTFRNSAGEGLNYVIFLPQTPAQPPTGAASSREFVTQVLMNDTLWERLLPHD